MIEERITLPIGFNAKVWLQGNSLLVTVPMHFRENFNLQPGEILQIAARKITKEELEYEKKLHRIMSSYHIEVSGSIINKGVEIAKIGKGFVRTSVIRAGTSIAGDPQQLFDNLVETTIVHGAIVNGTVLPSASEKKHFGVFLRENETKIMKDLLYGITMKLKTIEGKTLKIKNIRFDEDLPTMGHIEIMHFTGDLEDGTKP